MPTKLRIHFKDMQEFEAEATKRGVPETELRFIFGICIAGLIDAGVNPVVLIWYCNEVIKFTQNICTRFSLRTSDEKS